MTRPLRIEYEDAYYHVMNRGRGRQQVFPGTDYYKAFLKCLSEAHDRFGIEAHAWCLMGNHYHLLLKTPRGNLSRAMRHIDGVYTQRHNRLRKTDGPLFRGRYKSIVIDASSYLLQVSRYIHRNPIEVRTPLVGKLEDYPWSSYGAYIDQAEVPAYLTRDSVYGDLGSRRPVAAYLDYVTQGDDEETQRFYGLKNRPAIWGDQHFKEYARERAVSQDQEIDKKGLTELAAPKDILKAVASYYGVPLADLKKARRGRGVKSTPRRVAMKLCQQLAGSTLQEMAGIFNVGHYSTVSQTIGRLNREMEDDHLMVNDFKLLSDDLQP
ncbi:MAG: transposase [Immundisolibacteraceae bacterium]|nr:transposase [Immundisolibacteraceae bacterium]